MTLTNLSSKQVEIFNKDGFVIIKNFCSKDEVKKLYHTAIEENQAGNSIPGLDSAEGKKAKVATWFSPNDDVFGYLSRSEKMVLSIAQLLQADVPVCHIQSKLMEKKAGIGGVWEWHQDYAYWSQNQFMKASQMICVMVALTAMNKYNGGSQVIKGSHKLRKIKHSFGGDKVGADMKSVNAALEKMELVYPELEEGDAIFFHSNLLHRADANLSDASRWSIISCYSAQSNLAKKAPFISWYTPVNIVPDEAILEWENPSRAEKDFLKPATVKN